MKILFLIFFTIVSFTSLASSPCDDLLSKEIDRIQLDPKTIIVACAENPRGVVNDLTVLKVKGEVSEPVFEGDAAVKSYTIEKKEKTFVIQESMSSLNSKPFLQIKIICINDKCQSLESCIWKKAQTNEALILKVREEFKKEKPNVSDIEISDVFTSALNGNSEARSLFSLSPRNVNVSGTETFETLKAEVPRLKKALCF